MTPLIVLVVATLALVVLGRLGVRRLEPWPVALRGGLAVMFLTTGVVHFVGMRAELISMVPPALPAAGLLVTVTGVAELAGAAGLLWSRTALWAAAGLSVLLVAMYPANVYAALEGFGTPLLLRTAVQLVLLAATTTVLAHHLRGRRVTAAARSSTGSRGGGAASG